MGINNTENGYVRNSNSISSCKQTLKSIDNRDNMIEASMEIRFTCPSEEMTLIIVF